MLAQALSKRGQQSQRSGGVGGLRDGRGGGWACILLHLITRGCAGGVLVVLRSWGLGQRGSVEIGPPRASQQSVSQSPVTKTPCSPEGQKEERRQREHPHLASWRRLHVVGE